MWSDARCSYASMMYQLATVVALAIGHYVGVAPGVYSHMTLGDDTIDQEASDHIDQMLRQETPQDTGEDGPFCRQMHVGK